MSFVNAIGNFLPSNDSVDLFLWEFDMAELYDEAPSYLRISEARVQSIRQALMNETHAVKDISLKHTYGLDSWGYDRFWQGLGWVGDIIKDMFCVNAIDLVLMFTPLGRGRLPDIISIGTPGVPRIGPDGGSSRSPQEGPRMGS